MKQFKSLALLFFTLASWVADGKSAPDSVTDLLAQHFQALGATERLATPSSHMRGELLLANLTIPFEAVQWQNSHYYFKQQPVLRGMDLTPPIIKLLNDQGAYFVVDETDLGRGVNVTKLPDDARSNWTALHTTALSPLYYFEKMGFNMRLAISSESESQTMHHIAVTTHDGGQILVLVDGKSHLIQAMVFSSYHPQLGMVEVRRTFGDYESQQGLLLPTGWTDHRAGMDIVYSLTEIGFTEAVDQDIFAVGPIANEPQISNEDIKTVLDDYLQALHQHSPFVAAVAKIETGLQHDWQQGLYQHVTSPRVLSSRLTERLIQLSGDHHFGIEFNPDLFNWLNENPANEVAITRQDKQRLAASIQSSRLANNDLFYLKITEMMPLAVTAELIDSLMSQAAVASGLIIDLRDNTGGAADFNQYVVSHLLPKDKVLYQRVLKDKTVPIRTIPTKHDYPSLQTMPVFVIVNKNTVSAGEQLAYLLQNHQRAKVLGETTFGAAHGSIDVPLSKGLIGLVPIAYEQHVTTHQDWEGSGVVPDILAATNDLNSLIQLIGDLR
ncbi:S41 family peptidase [Marinicella meishanensis]|uniref:S41 family peptidase n=1 Tax=Marinicella meishanensis TaxID=2873263 RepID=UPI001CC02EF9|nr:S41 family peptidase [Marinicella sp. NBU2979]